MHASGSALYDTCKADNDTSLEDIAAHEIDW